MVHRKCAICKHVVTIKDVTRVSFRDQPKPVGDTAQEGRPLGPNYTPLPQCITDIPLVGSFGTKIDAIVRHMLYILSKDSTEKMILYSNESTAVKICMLAMEQNGIGCTAISGARKKVDGVKAFKESARISVLILQAKSQAAGLTLTVATHVFILEPQLNISVELQGTLKRPILTA
jgi:E3 ubiquitin-protein ligase SHPRH